MVETFCSRSLDTDPGLDGWIDGPTQRCREGGRVGDHRRRHRGRTGSASSWAVLRAEDGHPIGARLDGDPEGGPAGSASGVGWWPGQRGWAGHRLIWGSSGGSWRSCFRPAGSAAGCASYAPSSTGCPGVPHEAGFVGSPQVGPDRGPWPAQASTRPAPGRCGSRASAWWGSSRRASGRRLGAPRPGRDRRARLRRLPR